MNTLLPLIVIPHIVSSVGLESFGVVSVAIASMSYFIVVTEYGFNFTGTKQVSISRKDKVQISKIFSTVQTIKFLLLLLSFFVLSIALLIFKFTDETRQILILSFGLVIGKFLFPVWFFQGLEKIRIITLITVLFRLGYAITIFTFINGKEDVILIPIFNGLSVIIPGILSLLFLRFVLDIRFVLPSFSECKVELYKGWHLFTSTFVINLYTGSPLLILSMFGGTEILGLYAAVDKILRAAKSALNPVSQALFPRMSITLARSKPNLRFLLQKVLFPILVIVSVGIIIGLIFTEELITFSVGDHFIEMIDVLRIGLFIPFFVAISNVSGLQFLVNLNEERYFGLTTMKIALLGLLIMLCGTWLYLEMGLIVAVLITEMLMALFMIKKLIKII